VDTRASPKPGTHLECEGEGRANGCRYFGCKEKTRKKSNDTGTETKTGKHQDMRKKAEEKALDTQQAVCLGIKEEDKSTYHVIWK